MVNGEFLLSQEGRKQARHLADICKQKIYNNLSVVPGITTHMIKTLLHFHINNQHRIIDHYLRIHYSGSKPAASTKHLDDVIEDELKMHEISKHQDVKYLKEIRHSMVVNIIHNWLSSLQENVCLIQWCSQWKNQKSVWTDKHAPLGYMITPNVEYSLRYNRRQYHTRKRDYRLPSYSSPTNETFKSPSYLTEDLKSTFASISKSTLTSINAEDLIIIIKLIRRRKFYHVSVSDDSDDNVGSMKYDDSPMSEDQYEHHKNGINIFLKYLGERNKEIQEKWRSIHPRETYREMNDDDDMNEDDDMTPATIEEDTNYQAQFQLRVCGQKPAKKINCRL